MIKLNENGTVRFAGIKPEMLAIRPLVEQVFNYYGYPLIITAGTEIFNPEGKRYHMIGSKHDTGEALDFRTHMIPTPIADKIYSDVRLRLTPEYQIVREKGAAAHMHVEFDP